VPPSPEEIKKEVEQKTPDVVKKFDPNALVHADDYFTGEIAHLKNSLVEGRIVEHKGAKIAAEFDAEGNVMCVAAAISRTPTASETYLADVPDLTTVRQTETARKSQIALFRQIFKKEGTVNNAIKKKASLVSQDGSYVIRAAKQGKRPAGNVETDLLTLLMHWVENVNSDHENAAVTGSRGLKQVVLRGSRQAMIEGDLFLREEWKNVKVPTLGGKSFKLPILLQAMPADEVEIAEGLFGFGIELYYWVPSSEKINTITRARDPEVKKLIQKIVSTDVLSQLRKNRKALLDASLLVHIKHSGTDTDPYGQSDVEAAATDIAYARALKQLDFVTIDSLINRMLIIKVGDENPDSAYHNLAVAQKRVNVLANLIRTVGPNMMVLWAGHDISSEDIGAHDAILDTDTRQATTDAAVKLATGVPEPVLTGTAEGGNAVAWAGFLALGAVVSELQEEWAEAITQLGRRIAEQNNFKDVDLVWQFTNTLLADREASTKLMIQAFDRGALSLQSLLEELGKDYSVEKRRKIIEEPDADLFEPPALPMGGPGGNQGIDPSDQPGKPDDKGNPDRVGPERDRERKKPN
jgi:hypothetical protein